MTSSIVVSGVLDSANAVFPSIAIDAPIVSSSRIFIMSRTSLLKNHVFSCTVDSFFVDWVSDYF